MTKILKVIKPFYVMEVNDTFELSQDGTVYSSVFNEVFDNQTDNGVTTKATYTSDYTISKEYAKQLIEQGYLAEVAPKEEKPFVNSKYCSKVREHYPITPIRYALTSLLIILVADKRKEGENRYKFLLRIGDS